MKRILSVFLICLTVSLFGQNITTPSTQASNVALSLITTTSMKVTWTSGSGANELVVVRPASSAIVYPNNTAMPSYTANTIYGSGTNLGNSNYVVYKGSGNTVTITGLTPNVNYEVVVYSYNYGCTSGFDVFGTWNCTTYGFLVKTTYSSGNSEQHFTLATEPTAISTISVIGTPSSSTATLGYGNTSSSYNLVHIYDASLYTNHSPIDGTSYTASSVFGNGSEVGGTGTKNYVVAYSTANSQVNVTNLAPASRYYAVVYPFNGQGSSTNNSYNYYTNSIGWVYFTTVNSPPTINAISNISICQDALTNTVALTGISKGTNTLETQNVSITATSNNTLLIPNPTVYYTSPSSTGSLTFKPNAGQSGTAIITVTANDGGPTTNITVRTFTVVVKGIPASAGAISTATTTLCKVKNGVVFSVPTIANATNYNWSLPSGATIISGSNTNSITVNFSTTVNSHSVTVYGNNSNGCGNGSTSGLLVNFDNVPTISNAGTNQQICNNLTALSANAPAVGTGNWSYCSSGLFNINPTTAPNANLTVLNNVTVTAVWTITNGVCPASSSTVVVTNINGSPSCTPYAEFVANNTEICSNGVVTFSNTSVAAVGVNTYTWNFGSGATPATSTSTAAAITVTYSTVGTKTITLSMNSGSGDLTEIKNAYINVITSPSAPGSVSGNTLVCQGKSAEPYFISSVANATGYTWSFPSGVSINTGANTNAITANFSTTATSGNIGVTATNNCGSSSITNLSVTVNPIPTIASSISGTTTVCQGQSNVVYNALNLNNGLSYNWSIPSGANIVSGLNTKTVTVSFDNNATDGVISVYGTNGCGDGPIKTVSVTVNPLPANIGLISGANIIESCPLSTGLNYSVAPVDFADNYVWVYPVNFNLISGANSNSILLDATTQSSNGNIKVVAKNSCGNSDTSSIAVNVNGLPSQEICLVTVDEVSQHNEIIWQKNAVSGIDSFRVYRVQSALLDTLIETVAYNDLSRVVDVNSNPNITSYTYKIAAVDSCGNEGPKSLTHQTIHLQSIYSQAQNKTDLSWNLYDGATVNLYRVFRDVNNSGNWIPLVTSLAPNVTSFTDFTVPAPGGTVTSVQYRVDVDWLITCDPTARVENTSYNTTKSNTKDFVIDNGNPTAISELLLNTISVYPNPTSNMFTIRMENVYANTQIKIINQLGETVKEDIIKDSDNITIDVNNLSTGVYFVNIKTPIGSITKKITKL